MSNKSILILGKPHSGKTTFVIQFYNRLVKNKSEIILYKSVENISLITDDRERLSRGEETQPTQTEKFEELILPIEYNGQKADIKYPDFAGEQITKIVEQREVNKNWNKALSESDTWILFIRLSSLTAINDLSNQTVDKEAVANSASTSLEDFEIADQSFFIELLQILLQIKGHNYHLKIDSIKLTIVLTCWDELHTEDSPQLRFRKQLPLLLNFIEANWHRDSYRIFGLSSQEFKLDTQEAKDKYLDEGPENFGYLIKPDESKTKDITLLITEVI
jgi:GTPase SAR1 family protein